MLAPFTAMLTCQGDAPPVSPRMPRDTSSALHIFIFACRPTFRLHDFIFLSRRRLSQFNGWHHAEADARAQGRRPFSHAPICNCHIGLIFETIFGFLYKMTGEHRSTRRGERPRASCSSPAKPHFFAAIYYFRHWPKCRCASTA